jgi:LCP family protein required for cell wall assembly
VWLVARIAIAALSVLVLAVTGYCWSQVQALAAGLTRANVIGPGPASGAAPVAVASVSPEQNILLVGLDTRSDAQGNPLPRAVLDQLHAGAGTTGGDNTDTMIVVHIPAGSGTATAISIPRDSYVAIAGGYGTHKINSAYTYGKHAAATALSSHGVSGAALEVQSAAQGARTAILTVQQLTGLTITHYGAVTLVGFAAISQAVGGVPVCLNNPVDDPLSGAVFPAGPQVLQGAQALAFVRQRHGLPLGDLDRIKRQQVFLASLARTVLSGATLTDPGRLSALLAAIEKALTIDQGWDVLSFAQQLQGLSAGHITFTTIPIVSPSLRTPDDGDAVQVNPHQVLTFVQGLVQRAAFAPTNVRSADTANAAAAAADLPAAGATPTRPAPTPTPDTPETPGTVSAADQTCVD